MEYPSSLIDDLTVIAYISVIGYGGKNVDAETEDLLKGILGDFAAEAIAAWKENSEIEMDAAIERAIHKIGQL